MLRLYYMAQLILLKKKKKELNISNTYRMTCFCYVAHYK